MKNGYRKLISFTALKAGVIALKKRTGVSWRYYTASISAGLRRGKAVK